MFKDEHNNPYFEMTRKNHMEFSKREFEILDVLDNQVITTQRQLSEFAGISLGLVNYVIKSLLEKGLVKLGDFRKNPRKISYAYLLTPKEIDTKSKLAVKFVTTKLRVYHSLRNRLARRLNAVEKKGHVRIMFVGPKMVNEFLGSIIKENNLDLLLVGCCQNRKDLKDCKPETYDVALLFDGSNADFKKTKSAIEIPQDKILPFW